MNLAFFVILIFAAQAGILPCQSTPESNKDRTTWESVYELVPRDLTTNRVQGRVFSDDAPLEGVLVEIFDHPEKTLESPLTDEGRRRLAACFTDRMGIFCFPDLPPGEYEIRYSMAAFATRSELGIKVVNDKSIVPPIIKVTLSLAL